MKKLSKIKKWRENLKMKMAENLKTNGGKFKNKRR